ncbi:MAG TPA: OmpA family protein [Bdellovibrionota bacterium]|jgi:chemotaxis protein MotB
MKPTRLCLYSSALAAAFASGCVSSGRYKEDTDTLKQQLAMEKDEHESCKKQAVDVEQKLATTVKDRGALKASLDDMKKAMDEMKARQAEERKRLQEFADLTKRFKRLTDSGALSVKIVDGKMVVSLGSDLLFGAGSARLSKEGMQAVKEVSTQLAAIPEKRYQVEGHTDNQPISTATFPSNWELASARALTVVKAMIDQGMSPDRVSAASFADTKPVKANDSVESRAANRRVAIVIVPDLSSLPGYDELQKYSQ